MKSKDVGVVFHDETRGCLFDMCGLKEDIIVSHANPQICPECESAMRRTLLPIDYIEQLKKEIKQIKKPLYYRLFDWIKMHPVLSILITSILAIILNIISSIIYYNIIRATFL